MSHLAVDDLAQPDEFRIEPVFAGGAGLRQIDVELLVGAVAQIGQQEDTVADEHRFIDAVGHEQDGAAGAIPDPQRLLLQLLAGLHVERGERLVHQHDPRPRGEHAREPDALPHAAGEMIGIVALETGQPHQRRHFLGHALLVRPRASGTAQAEGDVLRHRHPVEQRGGLEHDAAVGSGPVDLPAVDKCGAAGRRKEAGDHVEDRGLAAAGRAEQHDDLAAVDVERRVAHDRAAVVAERHVIEFEYRARHLRATGTPSPRSGDHRRRIFPAYLDFASNCWIGPVLKMPGQLPGAPGIRFSSTRNAAIPCRCFIRRDFVSLPGGPMKPAVRISSKSGFVADCPSISPSNCSDVMATRLASYWRTPFGLAL